MIRGLVRVTQGTLLPVPEDATILKTYTTASGMYILLDFDDEEAVKKFKKKYYNWYLNVYPESIDSIIEVLEKVTT